MLVVEDWHNTIFFNMELHTNFSKNISEIDYFDKLLHFLFIYFQDIMNREKEDQLPLMQVGFIDSICLPIYEVSMNNSQVNYFLSYTFAISFSILRFYVIVLLHIQIYFQQLLIFVETILHKSSNKRIIWTII